MAKTNRDEVSKFTWSAYRETIESFKLYSPELIYGIPAQSECECRLHVLHRVRHMCISMEIVIPRDYSINIASHRYRFFGGVTEEKHFAFFFSSSPLNDLRSAHVGFPVGCVKTEEESTRD